MMPRLLLVDDDPMNLEIIAEFLSEDSPELVMAHDGEQAWQALETEPSGFDVVILDRVMPRMDGLELLRKIRAERCFDNLPVIMQTAASEPENMAEGLAAGAWYYLGKPYTEVALNSIVRAALYDRQNRLELVRLGDQMQELLGLIRSGVFRFRDLNQARRLAACFGRMFDNDAVVAMGLSELMLNAIEHGNLGIDYTEKSRLLAQGCWHDEINRRLASQEQAHRWAEVEVSKGHGQVQFTIRDQGAGFAWNDYLELDPSRAFDSHGRGIAMARQMAFSSLEYQDKGNVVRVTLDAPD